VLPEELFDDCHARLKVASCENQGHRLLPPSPIDLPSLDISAADRTAQAGWITGEMIF
jgi:hypothetical protein